MDPKVAKNQLKNFLEVFSRIRYIAIQWSLSVCSWAEVLKKRKGANDDLHMGGSTMKITESHYYQRRNDPFWNIYDKVVESSEVADTYFTYFSVIDNHNK